MPRPEELEPLVKAEDVRLTEAEQRLLLKHIAVLIDTAQEAGDGDPVYEEDLTTLCRISTKLTGRDAWGRPLMSPDGSDGHSWWGCNNYECLVHPNESYQQHKSGTRPEHRG